MIINTNLDGYKESRISENGIDSYHTIIRVIGAGGAGNNTINRLMMRTGSIKGIETIAINTDAQDLLEINADKKILIGKSLTGGLGAGGDPEIGERSIEESKKIITDSIEGTDILFLTSGLGGGTGTGSMPIIGNLAREKGILTIAIVTMPLSVEGIIRWENAQIGLEKLKKTVDTLIVLRNDKLLDWVADKTLMEAFQAGDEILVNALTGLSDMILKKGLINLDFADVSMVMRDGPEVMIGLGESSSENRIEEAIRKAISHPLMEADISGSQSVLIHITGGMDITLKEARQIIQHVVQKLDSTARIIWGVTIDKNLKNTIRILLIVSGLRKLEKRTINKVTSSYIEKGYFEEAEEITGKSNVIHNYPNNGKSIFDIKESILASGEEVSTSTQSKPVKEATQTTAMFYNIFTEEAEGDLKRFDRSIHLLRENPQNQKALLDAKQACKLIHASAQMFGFDEIAQLLSSVEGILDCVQSEEFQLTPKIIDSITLAIEMVVDLLENRSDGKGQTGYIVDRLQELKREKLESLDSK